MEAWFKTDLVRIKTHMVRSKPGNKRVKFSAAFTTPEAATDPNRQMVFCIDLTPKQKSGCARLADSLPAGPSPNRSQTSKPVKRGNEILA